jgi:REP element-mobilizing transposase RayT
MDRYLDETRFGPTWLRKQEIAELVAASIQYAESQLQFYTLHAWVIMSNHVHLLVSPHVTPARFLQSVKGYTARESNRRCNALANRFGKPNPTTTGCATHRK